MVCLHTYKFRCFIGGYYELTGSTVARYDFAGSQRVAIRKYTIPQSMSVEYLLTDHLGSTSLTTDSSGARVSELRYTPFGEIRSSWIANPSTTPPYTLIRYTFTGQYSYMDDPAPSASQGFGLMFYVSRWYDPSLGRFAQADSIIPPGVQGLDRYVYVNNNPVRYNDPSGHKICTDDGYCGSISDTSYQKYIYSNAIKDVYKWNLKGNWSLDELKTIYQTGRDIEQYVDSVTGGNGLDE
jgi:RHS repeat-associated protein